MINFKKILLCIMGMIISWTLGGCGKRGHLIPPGGKEESFIYPSS